MVATRKNPSVPAPPTSRSSSTQALPRASNAKSTQRNLATVSNNNLESSSKVPPNGSSTPEHKTNPQKSKSQTPLARKEKRSLADRFFFFLLAAFAAYALYTCPSDSSQHHVVCRSLQTYRTHVLEPYVIPPIRAAITHPAVVQPYEKYAKPVYQSYIQPVTPYVAAAHRQTAPYVHSVVRISKHASCRVWNAILKPYWTRAVVPRYTLYLQPLVEKYVSPLVRRVKYYNHRAGPYVRSFAHHISISIHKTQNSALVAYTQLQPYTARAYSTAKPHVLRGYTLLKPIGIKVAGAVQSKGKYVTSQAMVLSQVVLGRFGDLRRQFVDPHILRIWEKAAEKSGLSTSESQLSSTISVTTAIHSEPSNFSFTLNMGTPTIEMESRPTASAPESSHFPLPSPDVSKMVGESGTAHAPTSITTPEDTLEKAMSVAEASAAHASNIIAEMESEIKESQTMHVLTPDSVEPQMPTSIAKEQPPAESPHTQEVSQESAGSTAYSEDLAGFLQEIGLEEEAEVPEPESESEPEPVVHLTEEDLEARKAATAAKRANIVERHVRWQSELDTLVKDLEIRVKRDIEVIRKEAITHIGRLPSDKDSSSADGKGRWVIDKVQNDGERLLKGLETYVDKLASQKTPQDLQKEIEIWKKVIDKVEDKFKVAVRGVQEDVHQWYLQIREEEASVVLAAAAEVKDLAGHAQADVGYDYAWLADVTYDDWQKYHDLMRVYERFDQTARSLQNGTHSDAPADDLIPVLDKLDHHVQQVIYGFVMRMNSLVRQGDDQLSDTLEPLPEPPNGNQDEDEECEEDGDEEPQVSILPIPSAPSIEEVDPANVVIGKSAEQVEKMAQQAVTDQRIEL